MSEVIVQPEDQQNAATPNVTQELLMLLGTHEEADIPTPMGQCAIVRDGDGVILRRQPLTANSTERRMSVRLGASGNIERFILNGEEMTLLALPELWPHFDVAILVATFRTKEERWLKVASRAS